MYIKSLPTEEIYNAIIAVHTSDVVINKKIVPEGQ